MEKEKQNKNVEPQPVYLAPFPPQAFEEDEIDLIELFKVLLKRKYIIFSFTIFAAVLSVIITLLMPNIYQSDAVIIPRGESKGPNLGALGGIGGMVASELGIGGGGSIEEMQSILKSKRLIMGLIKEKNLLPRLFPDGWDEKIKQWKDPEKAPTLQDGYNAIIGILHLNYDKKLGTLKVAIQHEDPVFAKQLVEWLIQELSETLRQRTLDDSRENIKFFQKEIKKTSDPLLKEKLYASLAKEIERRTFAMAQKYYGFQVLDPPIVPDKNKKVKPKRAMICTVSTISAFFISIFFVFFLEYIENARAKLKE
ncbi:Lipopolysaccharide biosynthesis [Dissulfuribacter thermophilus]|uniref:Lipopolysaccharide biosynthesis n=1 Tax=Dissulfuribacter thermophilus TaxID=1156395 RepID=A0A1B9F407_9BACT|nr:Wzz/FepE/Etk N-terminal domain-containing protein [Dissulfuribacter thermophilus]OCC14679.1 Lipopolysaccharide biosynthesis [Dissulfuribacter thermophilus]